MTRGSRLSSTVQNMLKRYGLAVGSVAAAFAINLFLFRHRVEGREVEDDSRGCAYLFARRTRHGREL